MNNQQQVLANNTTTKLLNQNRMEPKEKAKELLDKYFIICQEFTEEIQCSIQAKQCALIAVDEIIEALKINSWQNSSVIDFYNKVLTEINK